MDVAQITDIKELKALAYDQLILQEHVTRNLAVITARITELEGVPPAPDVQLRPQS